MFTLLIITALLLCGANFLLLLVFLQLKNVQSSINRLVMQLIISQHGAVMSDPFSQGLQVPNIPRM